MPRKFGGRAEAHVIRYFGTANVGLESGNGFRGTFVAPNAHVDLNSRTHIGAVYSKRTTLHQGGSMTFERCKPLVRDTCN